MKQMLAMTAAALGTIVTGLALIVTPVSAAPGPTAATPPTASTAPPKPKAGAYVGATSQGKRFSLQVGPSRTRLTALSFRFQLRCTRRRAPVYIVSPIVFPWRLNAKRGLGFSRVFLDTTGERYTLTGTFDGNGSVTGTLESSWESLRNGNCSTGRLEWHAHLSAR